MLKEIKAWDPAKENIAFVQGIERKNVCKRTCKLCRQNTNYLIPRNIQRKTLMILVIRFELF